MPYTVVLAAGLQLLLAAVFVVMLLAYRRAGPKAQRAADAQARQQGVDPEVLAEHGIRFEEGAWALWLSFGIAAVLAVLGGLNSAGLGIGRLLSWILEPVVLIGVGYVTTVQVFAVPFTVAALAKSADPRVRDFDVRAVLYAGVEALPRWYRPVTVFRWVLATVGSIVVIVALATPSAGAYFSW
ncbi:hypothetical protein [Nocardia sp. CA-135398]|uniref:hypothetical protein n=1 Tax=Nocardia sp. CA-135398 TaxID=3239977 RepID=UPI003D97BD0D